VLVEKTKGGENIKEPPIKTVSTLYQLFRAMIKVARERAHTER